MKILTADKIRQADQYTIQNEPISSIDLMERASREITSWITQHFDNHHPIFIFAGIGNNRGDGLAVARLLFEKRYNVSVFIVEYANTKSEDCTTNLQRLHTMGIPVNSIKNEDFQLTCPDKAIIVDALFGSGLNRKIEGFSAKIVDQLNHAKGTKIAIDVPSGLFADEPSTGTVFKADHTLSLELPKLGLLLPDNQEYVGNMHILPIQLHPIYLKEVETDLHYMDDYFMHTLVKPRFQFNHKGSFGHSLLIGGSKGMIGSILLSTKAALRSGCGLASVYSIKGASTPIHSNFPEAMVMEDDNEAFITALPDNLEKYKSIGFGPGLGQNPESIEVLEKLLCEKSSGLVLDADALNLLSNNRELLKKIPRQTILTPHPGEFARLVGKWENDFDKLEKLKSFCKDHNVIVVLKGKYTCIGFPNGHLFLNNTGNHGMATGGSGDVLTGIITGLLAQGYSPTEAALFGTYWHGLAGDHAANELTPTCMIASDIINHLSNSRKEIGNHNLNYNL